MKSSPPFGIKAFQKLTPEMRERIATILTTNAVRWSVDGNIGMLPFVPDHKILWAIRWYFTHPEALSIYSDFYDRYDWYKSEGLYTNWG